MGSLKLGGTALGIHTSSVHLKAAEMEDQGTAGGPSFLDGGFISSLITSAMIVVTINL